MQILSLFKTKKGLLFIATITDNNSSTFLTRKESSLFYQINDNYRNNEVVSFLEATVIPIKKDVMYNG
jgi:hypothetical protein